MYSKVEMIDSRAEDELLKQSHALAMETAQVVLDRLNPSQQRIFLETLNQNLNNHYRQKVEVAERDLAFVKDSFQEFLGNNVKGQ